MAERVIMFKAEDGTLFPTELEAENHGQRQRIFDLIEDILHTNGVSSVLREDLAEALTSLVMNERAERDHYWSVTNNDD